MSKRPAINLSDLTSEAAVPMVEASQRTAQAAPGSLAVVPASAPSPAPASRPAGSRSGSLGASAPAAKRPKTSVVSPEAAERTKTAELQPLAFKVSPAFSKRFRRAAFDADLKLNELLFEAFEAWEKNSGK